MIIKTLRNIEIKKHKDQIRHQRKLLRYDRNPLKKPARYVYHFQITTISDCLIFAMDHMEAGIDLYR